MAKKENTIEKSNWMSSFAIVGEAKLNDYTFKIDEKSEKSDWVYNTLNLGVDCGEKHGVVYTEMMGGYSSSNPSVIYAHGKNEDGSDDFSAQVQVAWEDRFNEDILATIGDLCFITVGLEKTDKGKTFYKKFLSAYDAIAYVKAHLEGGMVINVRGNLKYSSYQDKVQIRKNITSIVLSSVDETDKYAARFTQSILIDRDSVNLKDDIDKDKSVFYVHARVLDYVKEMNGKEIKGQFPFRKDFEFEIDLSKPEIIKKIVDGVFKVRKGITQITFEGIFVEGGATVTVTMDDVPEDIKALIALGLYTEEEALEKCSGNGSKEQRMVLVRPYFRLVGDDKKPELQKFEERYTEDDLSFNFASGDEDDESDNTDNSSADLDWLKNL